MARLTYYSRLVNEEEEEYKYLVLKIAHHVIELEQIGETKMGLIPHRLARRFHTHTAGLRKLLEELAQKQSKL